MKALFFCLMLAGCALAKPALLAAQNPTTVKTVAPGKTRDRNYVHEVKIIDEFIERFNDDKDSYLRDEHKRAKQSFTMSRLKLIQSLFNNPAAWTGKEEVKKFIAQVADSGAPQFLSITDSEWYAEVRCAFSANGRAVTIPLIMQMVSVADSGYTWMISGIGASPAFTNQPVKAAAVKEEERSSGKSISPTDYATNFLALHRVLLPSMNPANYFTDAVLATDRGAEFVQLIKSGKLKLQNTSEPKFHFFQIPNYVFTVEFFNRASTNSGWLINSLKAATDAEKDARKAQLLQRSL